MCSQNLHSATLYEFAITTVSNGISSALKTAKQTTGPNTVENLQAKSVNKREVFVSWNPPFGGADEYAVTIHLVDESTYELPVEEIIVKTEHIFSNLIPGSFYNIEVTPTSKMIKGKSASTKIYTKPGNVVNAYIVEESVTLTSFSIKWWGVEGNCKDIDVILTRLRKNNYEGSDVIPVVIKEERVVARDGESNEVTFDSLEPDTVYGIRLRAACSHDVGEDTVFTQTTRAPVQENKEESREEVVTSKEELEAIPKSQSEQGVIEDTMVAAAESISTEKTDVEEKQEHLKAVVAFGEEEVDEKRSEKVEESQPMILLTQHEPPKQKTSEVNAEASLKEQTNQENKPDHNSLEENAKEETNITAEKEFDKLQEKEENNTFTMPLESDTIKDLATTMNTDDVSINQPSATQTSVESAEVENYFSAKEHNNQSIPESNTIVETHEPPKPSIVNTPENEPSTDETVADQNNGVVEDSTTVTENKPEVESLSEVVGDIRPVFVLPPEEDKPTSNDSELLKEKAKPRELNNGSVQFGVSNQSIEISSLASEVKDNNRLSFLASLESADE